MKLNRTFRAAALAIAPAALLALPAYAAPDAVDALLGLTSDVQVESWSYRPRLSLIPGEQPAP